jgi:hypothetical protein
MSRRVVAASLVAAAAIGIPGSALAAGSGGHGPKPKPSAASTAPSSKALTPSDLPPLARSAGITTNKFQAGLIAAKSAGGNNAAAIAAFARVTGVSLATARQIIHSTFGAQVNPSITSHAAVAALAGQLGVSAAAARTALEHLGSVARHHGIDPTSPTFAAIAHGLGVSPARLAAALPIVKQALRPGLAGG